MKPRFSYKRNQGLTLIEVLVMIAVLAVLAMVLLPIGPVAKHRDMRISCVNNLKEIGLAYRVWEGDNDGKYPMQVSVTNGGAMELIATGNVVACFQAMSNEVTVPKILHCPADTNRVAATNFTTDLKGKISYFVNADASESYPQMILDGDDNFAVAGVPVKPGFLEISTNAPVSWTSARHKFVGNIGLADGSVQEISFLGLQQALQQAGATTNWLAIP